MNYDKLKEIDIENHIWIIYIIIIIASWYSNSLERAYFLTRDETYKKEYQDILVKVFLVLIIVYLYFLRSSLESIKDLKITDSIKKKCLTNLSAIGSLFIVISGLIYLYIAYADNDIDVEIAFN